MMLPQAPLAAFAAFADRMLDSWDIDPVYPVLCAVIRRQGLDTAQAEWLTILYLAYYELSSAVEAFLEHPDPRRSGILDDRRVLKLPTGIERRGLRRPELMQEHLIGWLQLFDGRSFLTELRSSMTDDPLYNNDLVDFYLRSVKFNGRWAAYKGAEVFHKVLDWPNAARDAGHENSTGPREGLTLFFPHVSGNSPYALCLLDYQTEVLRRAAAAHGVELEVEEVETLLCDFKSLTRGAYYVGHDIDLMLEGAHRAPPEVQRVVFPARNEGLPDRYLGEHHGWDRRDREVMRAYAQRGAILFRGPRGNWKDAAA